MSAESDLILAACAAALGARAPGEVNRLAMQVSDWDWVVDQSMRHAVLPLVAQQLGRAQDAVPPAVRQSLRIRYDENALRNVTLAQRLVDVIDALDAAAIAAIPIKGPVLATLAYGDLSLRQFADLDVVVAPRDLRRARAVLAGIGFEPVTALAAGPEAALRAADYHVPLVEPAGGIVLELHWALARPGWGGLRRDRWPWMGVRRTTVLGRELRALSPELLLVYLCVHASKHVWEQLQWACDVAAVRRAEPALDWDLALACARASGAERMLALGVELARDLLGLEPPPVAPRCDRVVRDLARDVQRHLWSAEPRPMRDLVAFQWRARNRRRDALAYCVSLAVLPQVADVGAIALPRSLRALYFALRPLRLLGKHASR